MTWRLHICAAEKAISDQSDALCFAKHPMPRSVNRFPRSGSLKVHDGGISFSLSDRVGRSAGFAFEGTRTTQGARLPVAHLCQKADVRLRATGFDPVAALSHDSPTVLSMSKKNGLPDMMSLKVLIPNTAAAHSSNSMRKCDASGMSTFVYQTPAGVDTTAASAAGSPAASV